MHERRNELLAPSKKEMLLMVGRLRWNGTAHYRMLDNIGEKNGEDAKELKQNRDSLKISISNHASFLELDEKRRGDILGCQEMFLLGKKAVVRSAGWDVDEYYAMFGLLSNHAHTSLLVFDDHPERSNFPERRFTPERQYWLCGLSIEYATKSLRFVCRRMFELNPDVFTPNETRH
jgi:hypothetical protein